MILLCEARRKGSAMGKIHKWIPIALIVLAAITAGTIYVLYPGKEESLVFNQKTSEQEESIRSPENFPTDCQTHDDGGEAVPSSAEDPSVCVYVCGSVRKEGVYYVSAEARVADAIAAAGGFADDAATAYLNLAERLTDGRKVYVPTVAEVEEGRVPVTPAQGTGLQGGADSGKININIADRQLLMSLPGIGETRAGDIIAWREKYGGFSEISDIMKVSGIKEAMFERIKDRICVR